MKETVYLIGFMGAGKTSVGKVLGEMYGYSVVDADELIIEREEKTINEIFAQHGEEYFRNLESQMLKTFPNKQCIVTTGGGIVINDENREFLKKSGRAVFLKCDPAVVAKRLEDDSTRPLLLEKSLEEITDMYNSRLPLYLDCAEITIDTTEQSIQEIAAEIAERLKL